MAPVRYSRIDRVKRAERLADAEAPFVMLPGILGHQVLIETSDGSKIRAVDLMQVFNDALMIDATCGPGSYAESYADPETPMDVRMREIYEKAVELYKAVELPAIWREMLDGGAAS